MILLTLSRGKGEETVRLQLPASPAEIGETFAFLDRISLDTTATAILDVSSNVPVLYRCLYDVDVEDSEQFQKLQKLAERTEALSPAKAAIFSGALDAECVWNLEGALTVADRLDEYMLVNNVSSDSELGIYLVNKGITPFPDRFKPYINYARVGAEYREKHGGEKGDDMDGRKIPPVQLRHIPQMRHIGKVALGDGDRGFFDLACPYRLNAAAHRRQRKHANPVKQAPQPEHRHLICAPVP